LPNRTSLENQAKESLSKRVRVLNFTEAEERPVRFKLYFVKHLRIFAEAANH